MDFFPHFYNIKKKYINSGVHKTQTVLLNHNLQYYIIYCNITSGNHRDKF